MKKSDNDAPEPSKLPRPVCQKKQSDWKWSKNENNPIVCPFSEYNGVF